MSYKLLFALNDIIEKLSPFHILHYQEQLLWGLNDLVELDNTRVADQFQNVDFSAYPLHICHVDYFLFLQDLYRHFLPCQCMSRRFYLTKRPFS